MFASASGLSRSPHDRVVEALLHVDHDEGGVVVEVHEFIVPGRRRRRGAGALPSSATAARLACRCVEAGASRSDRAGTVGG